MRLTWVSVTELSKLEVEKTVRITESLVNETSASLLTVNNSSADTFHVTLDFYIKLIIEFK